MVNVTIGGNRTVISKQSVLDAFIESRPYEFLKAGLSNDHTGVIRDWLVENYAMSEDTYDNMTQFVIWRLF